MLLASVRSVSVLLMMEGFSKEVRLALSDDGLMMTCGDAGRRRQFEVQVQYNAVGR
jgi:hypothetical protein